MIRTQIGGKFSRADNGIFQLKNRLVAAGAYVSHPRGNSIESNVEGMELSIDLNSAGISLFNLEIDYLRSIAESTVHIVHNKVCESVGYIGYSASIEIAYAMLKRKNICLLYQPKLSESVPESLRSILTSRLPLCRVHRIDLMSADQINGILNALDARVCFGFKADEEQLIRRMTRSLLRGYGVRSQNSIQLAARSRATNASMQT